MGYCECCGQETQETIIKVNPKKEAISKIVRYMNYIRLQHKAYYDKQMSFKSIEEQEQFLLNGLNMAKPPKWFAERIIEAFKELESA